MGFQTQICRGTLVTQLSHFLPGKLGPLDKATLLWVLATPLWRTDPPFPLGARLHPPRQSLLSVGAMLGRTICCSPGNSRCPSPWVQQPTQSFHGQGYMDSPRSRCCIHVVETAGLGPHDRALGGSSVTGACRDRAKADRTCQVQEAGPCVCPRLRDVRSQLSHGSHAHGEVGTKPHNTASPP